MIGGGGGGASSIRAGGAYVDLTIREQVSAALDKVRARINNIGMLFTKVGGLAVQGGAAVASPFALAAKVFMDFDDQMRMVKAVSEATGEQFAQLSDTARRLGRTTSFTAVQVASLMTELGKAGFKPDEIEAMTASVLNLARATGTDATLSAGIMSATLRQFSLDAGQAGRVADVLTKAANATFNSVESLGEALKYAAPVAADLGMGLEDTTAILGVFGNMGIQGSMAGTSLRRLMLLMSEQADLQRLFGVSGRDASGNLRPLVDVLGDIGDATKDMATGDRAAKFNEFFGLLGVTGASIGAKSAPAIRELRDTLLSAGGVAASTAQDMDSGIGGSWRHLRGAAESLAITVGDQLAPALMVASRFIELVAAKSGPWLADNRELLVTIAGVAGGLLAGGVALMGFGLTISVTTTAVGGLLTVLGATKAAIGLLFSPIGLVVAGMAALTYVFVTQTEAGQRWATAMKGFGLEAFGSIAETASAAWGGIKDAFAAGDLGMAWRVALGAMQLEWAKFSAYLTAGWGGIRADFLNTLDDTVAGAKLAWNDLTAALMTAWEDATNWIARQFVWAMGDIVNRMRTTANQLGLADALGLNDAQGLLAGINGELEVMHDKQRAAIEEGRKGRQAGIVGDLAGGKGQRQTDLFARVRDAMGAVQKAEAEFRGLLAEAERPKILGMMTALGGVAGMFGAPKAAGQALGKIPAMAEIADSVKGGFVRGSAAQQFGYGDKVGKQLDALKGIEGNTGGIPDIVNELKRLNRIQ